MKVLHVPYTYYPDPVGGTEVYVKELAKGLRELAVESVVCAPGSETRSYEVGEVKVHRIRGEAGILSVNYCYGDGDPIAASAFRDVLESERPDVVHIHAHSPMVSMRLAAVVKAMGLPLVFTYHTAAATCQRGTMLRWGRTPCAGKLAVRECASCIVQGRGMPKPLAQIVGRIPPAFGRVLQSMDLEGGPWTAARMSGLVERKHAATHSFLALADAIVAPAAWVRDVLFANGVPGSKIHLCGQGVEGDGDIDSQEAAAPGRLRIVSLSRIEPSKGLDVLVDAIAGMPGLDVTLDIYGRAEAGEGDAYSRLLERKIAGEPRVTLLAPIPHEHVIPTIRRYHVLAAPSQGFETGPLVVMEAFAAGRPVIGSDLAGIADHVAHERNGLLVPHASPQAWAAALLRLQGEPGLLHRLGAGVRLPPSMAGISARMKTLYEGLIPGAGVPAAAA